jgi:hypothetical protein
LQASRPSPPRHRKTLVRTFVHLERVLSCVFISIDTVTVMLLLLLNEANYRECA